MVLLVFAVLLGARPARALDTGDITIVSLKGDVHVTMLGAERVVHVGSILELPATLRTGRDGAVELRQGATSVDIGPDTLLEFPALASAGGPIDRIVQPRGNVFYSVGKRPGRKLRVETPLLVGVVKGTQFNVAVQGDSSTFSLFEGLLEIRAADESSVVDIKAGEIASRRGGDANIGVLKMDGKPATALPPRNPAGTANSPSSNPVGSERPAPVVPRASLNGDTTQDMPSPQISTELPLEAAPGARVPVVAAPVTGVPVVQTPVVNVPVVNVPAVVETPVVNVPVVNVPAVVDTPVVNVPVVNVPAVVETPVVNVPVVNVPAVVETPAVTVPAVNVPAVVETPAVTVPAINVPVAIETPAVSVPAVVEVPASTTTVVVSVPAANVDVGVSVGGVDLGVSVDLGNGNSQANPNAGPGNNNGNAGGGNNGNGKGNGSTGAHDSGDGSGDIDVDTVLNGLLKKPGKK